MATAVYEPARVAFTEHVKMVCVAVRPAAAPVVLVHDEDCPEMLQEIVPAGDSAPVAPVTVAVTVIEPPRTGLEGEVVTVIEGVAARTVTESGDAAESAAKLESPL